MGIDLSKTLIRPQQAMPVGYRDRVGVNLGNPGSVQSVLDDYEEWLGKPVHHVEIFNGSDSWSDVTDSIGHIGNTTYASVQKTPKWITIHTMPDTGATIAEAAAGAYQHHWIKTAKTCLTIPQPRPGPRIIRLWHEFNLTQQDSRYAIGQAEDFKKSYRNTVAAFRSVSPDGFRFRWCPNREDSGNNLADYYPGNDVVDIISMDHYCFMDTNFGGFSGNPTGANNYYLTTNNGKIGWLAKFAIARGKPWGIDEWGVSEDGFESYITAHFNYMRNWGCAYTAWWENNSAYTSELHNGALGTTGTAFQATLGIVPATPWTPANLGSAPTRWYNAQEDLVGVTNGTARASANDLSSNNADWTQATSGSQPLAATGTSGKRALSFDGTDDEMVGSGPGALGTNVTTMALVASVHASAAGSRHAFSFGNASAGQHRTIARIGSPANAFRLSTNGSNNDHDISAVIWDKVSGYPDIVIWTLDPGNTSLESTVWINGAATPYTFNMTGTAINTASTNAYLGGRIGSSTEDWYGDVYEALLIPGALASDAERQRLEGYLAWNAGAESKLDAAHPYKSAPPTL